MFQNIVDYIGLLLLLSYLLVWPCTRDMHGVGAVVTVICCWVPDMLYQRRCCFCCRCCYVVPYLVLFCMPSSLEDTGANARLSQVVLVKLAIYLVV